MRFNHFNYTIFRLVILFVFITLAQRALGQDTLNVQDVEEVRITGKKGRKQIAFKDRKYFIIDFEVKNDVTYLLVKSMSKYMVYALSPGMSMKDQVYLDFKPRSLFTDCVGNTHIISKDSTFQLSYFDEQLSIEQGNSRKVYYSLFKNCVASSDDGLIYQERKKGILNYYFISNQSESVYDLYSVVDSMEIMGLKEKKEKGIKIEYFESIRSRPTYNPLFVLGDTLYIFNHLKDKIVLMDSNGEVINQNSITYHQDKTWHSLVAVDQQQNKLYTVFIKNGALIFGLLSEDGQSVVKRIKLTKHPYPEKFIVHDGYIYYTYKTQYDDNLNKLYRHRL